VKPKMIAAGIVLVASLIVLRYALYHLFPLLLGAVVALLLWAYFSRKDE